MLIHVKPWVENFFTSLKKKNNVGTFDTKIKCGHAYCFKHFDTVETLLVSEPDPKLGLWEIITDIFTIFFLEFYRHDYLNYYTLTNIKK